MPANSNTASAARGTLFSISLRLASFLLSQLTFRLVSAASLGKASISLELLLSTALFVGREGFRLALTKEVGGDGSVERKKQWRDQQLINVSWLSIPAGAVVSILALFMHLHNCNNIGPDMNMQPEYLLWDYKLAGMLYCLSSFIETLSEPLLIRCLQNMDIVSKTKAEGAALVMKSLSCFGCLYCSRFGWYGSTLLKLGGISMNNMESSSTAHFPVTAFGISHLVYALVFTTKMYQYARSSRGGLRWPRNINAQINNPYQKIDARRYPRKISNFHGHTLYLVFIFTLGGLFKHALTEADKICLSALGSYYDQGVYALASSYGGLAARLLLQPMEENARLFFSRQGALIEHTTTTCHSIQGGDRDIQKMESTRDIRIHLEETYIFLVRAVFYTGLLFAAIASNYSSILLLLLAGNRWGSNHEASAALSAFCVLTAFLALNGITEAFVYGIARSGRDVGKIGVAHAVVGGMFAVIAPSLVKSHGAVGLVAANCISMTIRSLYSLHCARGYFKKVGRGDRRANIFVRILPNGVVTIAFGVSFYLTRLSARAYEVQIADGRSWAVAGSLHIGVGVFSVVMTASIICWLEKDIRGAIVTLVKQMRV